MLLTMFAAAAAALAIGDNHGPFGLALGASALLLAVGCAAYFAGRGRTQGWITLTACNVAFVALHVQLGRGRVEFLFGVFVLLGLLLVYRDWRPIALGDFAVVATEVRSLAQRSAQAAKEIKSLISDSVAKVDLGTQPAGSAGASMANIVSGAQRVNQLIGEIASAAGQQTLGITQVGKAVTHLDTVTQQNAALVEESAAAAESLRQQARGLNAVVQRFSVAAAAH